MSQLRHKLKPLLIMLLAAALLFSLVAPAWATEHEGEDVKAQDETLTCDHPIVAELVTDMIAEGEANACTLILGYVNQEEGVGLGQIMKAWYLSQSLPNYGETWENLLNLHLDGQGWGEVMFAYRFAASLEESELTGEQLLDLKKSGLGWGQIAKAQAVADAAGEGVTLDNVLADIEGELGWGEIRDKYNLEPGRPPWAGPPPWAKGNPKKNDVDGEELEGDESSGSGAPAFSGPPGQNRGNGNGPGNGRGNGPGNGNGNAFGHNKNK